MERLFRLGSLLVATIMMVAACAQVLATWIAAAGWTPATPVIWHILELIEPLRQGVLSPTAIGLSIGVTAGAWAGWLLRILSVRQRPETGGLADEMAEMMHRMRTVSEACHSSSYDEAAMVVAFSRFQALQMSLQKIGLRVPWRHWEPGEDPVPYLKANIGYLAFIEPLMRKGHLTVAIRTTRKSLGLGGAPRGPLMKVGASLKRVA